MQSLLMQALLYLLSSQLGRDLMDHLVEGVRVLADSHLSGAEKKAQLLASVTEAGGLVAAQALGAKSSLVNLAVELLVAKLKLSGGGQ